MGWIPFAYRVGEEVIRLISVGLHFEPFILKQAV